MPVLLTFMFIIFLMGMDLDFKEVYGNFLFLIVTYVSSISIISRAKRLPPVIGLDLNLETRRLFIISSIINYYNK